MHQALDWHLDILRSSPIHGSLTRLMAMETWQDWPNEDQLNALLDKRACTRAGQPLRFTLAADAGLYGAAAYESHVDTKAQIPLRPKSWHDLFNALMWALFPATKSALNAVHIRELANATSRRTARRDAITLFDECGVLLPVSDPALTALHAAHDWDGLFVEARSSWPQQIQPLVIGHGLYEQCLQPYVGLTAKALHWPVATQWFELPQKERYRQIDAAVASAIANDEALLSTKDLLPLPVLGIPGWWHENSQRDFYANRNYFRPSRPARS